MIESKRKFGEKNPEKMTKIPHCKTIVTQSKFSIFSTTSFSFESTTIFTLCPLLYRTTMATAPQTPLHYNNHNALTSQPPPFATHVLRLGLQHLFWQDIVSVGRVELVRRRLRSTAPTAAHCMTTVAQPPCFSLSLSLSLLT
jgi:hypothetical protein